MAESYVFGKENEKIAEEYLVGKGYKIIARNFFYQKAEIDLIAIKEDTICIIEVKARSYSTIQEPFEAVDEKKRKLILRAADFFIQENSIDLEARFDIISIVNNEKGCFIEHLEDAFGII